ncbi:MAG: substrate-binding domain-containing protein [Paracoccaceae bacterium]
MRSNIQRISAVLKGFDSLNTPRSTHAIISDVSMSRSTGFALLRALVVGGWLERANHGFLRLGPKAFGLAFGSLDLPQGLGQSSWLVATARSNRNQAQLPELEWDPTLIETVQTEQFQKPGPHRIGFSNASLSNVWRRAMMQSVKYARYLRERQHLKITFRHAQDDPAVQISQIKELVKGGIDILMVSAITTHDADLSDYLAELAAGGLPIVAVDRRPKNPVSLVSFITASDRRIGRISALWMAEHLKGKGRIWMLSGRQGTSPAMRRQQEALAAFAEFPSLLIESISATNWTPESGGNVINDCLQKYGNPPDGVWCDSGLQGVGSMQRFFELGIKIPAHTGGDLNEMYRLGLQQKVPFVALDYPASMGARSVEIALDILGGRPVPRRVEVPVQIVLPRGFETENVKADRWAETHVAWDMPNDTILSQGPSLRRIGVRA